jgi:hypothetical protein
MEHIMDDDDDLPPMLVDSTVATNPESGVEHIQGALGDLNLVKVPITIVTGKPSRPLAGWI